METFERDLDEAAGQWQLDGEPFDWNSMTEGQIASVDDVLGPVEAELRDRLIAEIGPAVEDFRRRTVAAIADFLAANPDIPTRVGA